MIFFWKLQVRSLYKLMKAMGVKSVYNHADFRLMSKRAADGLEHFKERKK